MASVSISEAPDRQAICDRLRREGRWAEAEPVKNALVKEARAGGMHKADAQAWAWSEIERLYPPVVELGVVTCDVGGGDSRAGDQARAREEHAAESGVVGLAELPAEWPPLPPNASLTSEIAWVQANRLRVTTGSEDRAVVDLSRALSPAPSHAAIGWLETSIRAYSKYCDIAAKATSQAEDEREHVRREKLAITEVRGLLSEMMDAEG